MKILHTFLLSISILHLTPSSLSLPVKKQSCLSACFGDVKDSLSDSSSEPDMDNVVGSSTIVPRLIFPKLSNLPPSINPSMSSSEMHTERAHSYILGHPDTPGYAEPKLKLSPRLSAPQIMRNSLDYRKIRAMGDLSFIDSGLQTQIDELSGLGHDAPVDAYLAAIALYDFIYKRKIIYVGHLDRINALIQNDLLTRGVATINDTKRVDFEKYALVIENMVPALVELKAEVDKNAMIEDILLNELVDANALSVQAQREVYSESSVSGNAIKYDKIIDELWNKVVLNRIEAQKQQSRKMNIVNLLFTIHKEITTMDPNTPHVSSG